MRQEQITAYRNLYWCLRESDHPIEIVDSVVRWKATDLGRWLKTQVDFNQMCIAFWKGSFSLEEYKQFYRDIGYSLAGFEEVFEGIEKRSCPILEVR